ncbi:hypothetical protein PI124_g9078 [Phytophthora idaei]|nr:hypothetical protein PI125_g8889 [Phytophthora idaei]KAG3157603.1 hypothetical protein PI126_g8221 [Phytophthora idaei]KAG3246203.1 hypothetical protein PI124_g9078 [Phytophthora idaei]
MVDEFFTLMSVLSVKDPGEVRKLLGMRVELDKSEGYALDQPTAIEALLEQPGLASANGVRVPVGEESIEVEDSEPQLLTKAEAPGEPTIRGFQSLVGNLPWFVRCTRPDISFAVHKATQRTHQPTTSDWKLAKRSARYLKDTKSLKLVMQVSVKSGDEVAIESWSNADFADDKDNMKSATRVVEAIDGAVVQ